MSKTFMLANQQAIPLQLQFYQAALAISTSQQMLMIGGSTAFQIPTGYIFTPMAISIDSSIVLSGGQASFAVTRNDVAFGQSFFASVNSGGQRAQGVREIMALHLVAGERVGLRCTTNATYAPTTATFSAYVWGMLIAL